MKIAKVSLGYGAKFSVSDVEAIKAAILPFFSEAAPHFVPIEGNELEVLLENGYYSFMMDVDKIPFGIKYTVDGVFNTEADTNPDTALERLETRPEPPVNRVVNVAIPGFGLLAIDDVMVSYDLCTDELRKYLEDGWRILAICPQPNQRRPDYVLGKGTK